jgi:hypothetical protein
MSEIARSQTDETFVGLTWKKEAATMIMGSINQS